MSLYTVTPLGSVRRVLALSEGQRALRALRPSFRSIKLPQRFVRTGVEGFRRDSTGYCIVPVYNDVPVFVRQRRSIERRVH